MNKNGKLTNRLVFVVEIILTVAICFGLAFSTYTGLSAEANNLATEVMADYDTLVNDYIRSFKILRMEAVREIEKDLSFDEMQAWALSRDDAFHDAVGDGIYDGFAFTYKGGYVHSWDYGDYSDYDPNSRPWYQVAEQASGEIAVAAPYTTYLSNTDLIDRYDTLRLSIVQKYSDDVSFDFDLNVKEINALIAVRQTIYEGTTAFLCDENGYVLSSTDMSYYGHNINNADDTLSQSLCDILLDDNHGFYGMRIGRSEEKLNCVYSFNNDNGMTVSLLIPLGEVFVQHYLLVLLLALILIGIETMFYIRTGQHLKSLEEGKTELNRALRQAESASHAKGDFMSRMSHEIRTPLNAVVGYLEIARDEQTDTDKVVHCIEKSQIASRHLLSIINDVLDISSIESGRMKLAHDDFDLKQMVNALTTLFYSQAKAKGIGFEVSIDSLDNERVRGDELRVRQILLNLLSNAVKFTPKGGTIRLNINQIKTENQENGGNLHFEFKVADTGIGMSEEYMKRIFRPFEQENADTARNFGGTGLGLSISNNLTHMMGGQIKVDSEQGKGTVFTVLLPFDRPSRPDSSEKESLATDSFSNLKSLIVDDDIDTCEYVQRLMERFGIKCDTVDSGKKALRRVTSRKESGHPYDLCVIDWNMKEMDGIETAREVRKICGNDIPIIIATAYDYTNIEEEAKAAGVDKIVSKPLFQSTVMNLLVNTYGKYTPTEPKKKAHADFKGMKVLLAEDNEMNMEIALDILRKAHLDITPVVNGKEALDAFEQSAPGTFDAILMDVQMPVMDGYTATRKIRESAHPQAKSIPVIAMTANAFTEDVTAALAAGMNDHVAKPISYDKLFATLSRLTDLENDK